MFLVQNILEFKGVLGRKSLYYPYRSTHKSAYLKVRRLLDYNYEDWESTTSLYLPDFNQTDSTHDVSKITTVTETVFRTAPNVTITGDALSTINTTPNDNFTANSNKTEAKDTSTTIKNVGNITTKETSVETTAEVKTEVTTISDVTNVTNIVSKDTIAANISILDLNNATTTGLNEAEDLLKALVSSTSSPLTTHIVSPPTIAKYSPGTVSESGPLHAFEISTPNPILEDIKELRRKDGYFTASFIVLLRILLTFERSYIRTLLGTLEFEVERRDEEDLLLIFGGKPAEVFLSALQILVPEPLDVMQSQLSYVIYALENRNSMFKEDVNNLLDITNTVYVQTDAEEIATVLADLKSFPNSSSAKVLIDGLLKTFVTDPFVRLQGSEREKLMQFEIHDIIEHRFGEHIFHRRMGLMGYGSTSSTFDETNKTNIYKTSLKPTYSYYKKALRTTQNEKKNNDYNYPDWEETSPDQYDFLFTTKPNSSSSSLTITSETSSSIPSSLSPSSSIETSTSTVVETTHTLITPSIRTTNTTVPINASSSLLDSTTLTSSTVKTELTDFPEVTEEDIFESTTTSVAVTTSTYNPIVDEIRNTNREGYFTASLLVLLRTAYAKDPDDLAPLLFTLHNEVLRMNTNHELNMFGPVVVDLFTSMVRVAATTNLELVRTQIDYNIVLLDDRRNKILPDINGIFDVADNIYNEDDIKNIANAIKDVKDYPEVQKEPSEIVQELFQAILFIPHGRIQGTTKERLLLLEINNAIQKRLQFGRRNLQDDNFDEESNRRRTQIRKTKQPILSTSPVEFMEDWNYVKNATIMEDVKDRMKKYKEKFKHIKKKEKDKFRGPTTTTTTTTTTIRPTMHKSNYYIRKYVKKNLYKMKTTTIKTTKFRYRYYGKIRKFNIEYSKSNDVYSRNDSEGYYSDDNIVSDESAISLEYNEDKGKKTTPLFMFNNNYNEPLTVKAITKASKNERNVKKLDDSDSDPELKLKLSLKDALIHSDFKMANHRRFLEHKAVKIKHNTFSDDEVVLKRAIYKVFGYKDNFADMIKHKDKNV